MAVPLLRPSKEISYMPIIKSAKKRVKTARRAAARNLRTKRSLKAAIKAFTTKVSGDHHKKAQSAVGKAVKKGVIHKNKAARKQRQLAAAAKKAATNKKAPAAKKPVAKKPAAKSTAVKKSAAKKAAKK